MEILRKAMYSRCWKWPPPACRQSHERFKTFCCVIIGSKQLRTFYHILDGWKSFHVEYFFLRCNLEMEIKKIHIWTVCWPDDLSSAGDNSSLVSLLSLALWGWAPYCIHQSLRRVSVARDIGHTIYVPSNRTEKCTAWLMLGLLTYSPTIFNWFPMVKTQPENRLQLLSLLYLPRSTLWCSTTFCNGG